MAVDAEKILRPGVDVRGFAGDDTGGGAFVGDRFTTNPDAVQEGLIDLDLSDFGTEETFSPDAQQDISLARPTSSIIEDAVRPKTTSPFGGMTDEAKSAAGTAVGSGVRAAGSIFSNMANLKAKDAIFMERIQRGKEELAYNQRLMRVDRDATVLFQNIKALQDLDRQSGSVAAGGQEQLFLKNSVTGGNL